MTAYFVESSGGAFHILRLEGSSVEAIAGEFDSAVEAWQRAEQLARAVARRSHRQALFTQFDTGEHRVLQVTQVNAPRAGWKVG